jgi:aminopeptidase-like protein
LKLGVGVIHPEGGAAPEMGEIVLSAHICHPRQANDNASAVAVAVEVARRLVKKPLPPGSSSVRLLLQPETVGTVCYLAANEDLIPRLRAGVVLESIGNRSTLALQHSFPGGAHIDIVADSVLAKLAPDHRNLPAWAIFSADEKVLNGPGVGVPSIMLTRAPYPEYHTSDDNLDVLDEKMLEQAADVAEEILRVMASDYVPERTFRGPVHLSPNGLWIPHETDRAASLLNQKAMLYFEGRHSIVQIAKALGADYWTMRGIVERYRAKGMVAAKRVPAPTAVNV